VRSAPGLAATLAWRTVIGRFKFQHEPISNEVRRATRAIGKARRQNARQCQRLLGAAMANEICSLHQLSSLHGFPLRGFGSIMNAYQFLLEVVMPIPVSLGLTRRAKPLTSKEGHGILERDRYRCQYCGLDGTSVFENSLVMTVDFVIPRAHKGKKNPTNLVAACRPCNVIKGQRVFASFEQAKTYVLQRRAELHKEWEAKMAQTPSSSVTA
jgi:hypothetical protein